MPQLDLRKSAPRYEYPPLFAPPETAGSLRRIFVNYGAFSRQASTNAQKDIFKTEVSRRISRIAIESESALHEKSVELYPEGVIVSWLDEHR